MRQLISLVIVGTLSGGCAEAICYRQATTDFRTRYRNCDSEPEPKVCKALAERQYDVDDQVCMKKAIEEEKTQ